MGISGWVSPRRQSVNPSFNSKGPVPSPSFPLLRSEKWEAKVVWHHPADPNVFLSRNRSGRWGFSRPAMISAERGCWVLAVAARVAFVVRCGAWLSRWGRLCFGLDESVGTEDPGIQGKRKQITMKTRTSPLHPPEPDSGRGCSAPLMPVPRLIGRLVVILVTSSIPGCPVIIKVVLRLSWPDERCLY